MNGNPISPSRNQGSTAEEDCEEGKWGRTVALRYVITTPTH